MSNTMRHFLILLLLLPQLAVADDLATLTEKDASLEQKARACQRLGESGTNECVSALAKLLVDQTLNVYARTALERLGSKEARQAMLAALELTEGNARLGVIQSLAAMNATEAEPQLAAFLSEEDEVLVSTALHALGRMGFSAPVATQLKHTAQGRRDLAAAVALQMSDKHLHQAILASNVSQTYHTGAHLKQLLSEEPIAPTYLANLLRQEEPAAITAAMLAIRERRSPELAQVLHRVLQTAKPPLTERLIHALGHCSNEQTIPLLGKAFEQSEGDSRAPYIETLSKLDGLEPLLPHVGDPAIDKTLVASTSARINGLLEDRLQETSTSQESVPIINVLGQRQSPTSLPVLMKATSSTDSSVQLAALEALRPIVGFSEVPRLIILYTATTDNTQKVAFRALVAASRKAPIDKVGKLLLAETTAATSSESRRSWLRILITLGYEPTLKNFSLDSPETINLLAAWPSTKPIESLRPLVDTPNLKSAAVSTILTLLEKSSNIQERINTLKTLKPAIRSLTEKRRYLAALGKTKHPDAQTLIETFAQDQPVSQEFKAARSQSHK